MAALFSSPLKGAIPDFSNNFVDIPDHPTESSPVEDRYGRSGEHIETSKFLTIGALSQVDQLPIPTAYPPRSMLHLGAEAMRTLLTWEKQRKKTKLWQLDTIGLAEGPVLETLLTLWLSEVLDG